MFMRNIFYSLLLIIFCAIPFSCSDEFLDETVTSSLDKEVIFSDSAYTEGFLTGIYKDIAFDIKYDRITGGLQTASDEAHFYRSTSISTDEQFSTGSVNPMIVSDDAWKKCYQYIRKCNIFLAETAKKEAEGKSVFVPERLKQYRAEARFLRAWYYHILLRHYGGIPLIGDEVFYVPEEVSAKIERSTYKDCVDYILAECEAAGNDFTIMAPRDLNYGRAGKGACLALKARVLLYATSALFNGSNFGTDQTKCPKNLLGYEDHDPQRWVLAKDAALFLISQNAYELNETHVDPDNNNAAAPGFGFYQLFVHSNYSGSKGFKGTIFEYVAGGGNNKGGKMMPPSFGGKPEAGYPYQELVDAFPTMDGLSIDDPKAFYSKSAPYTNRDPRLFYTVTVDTAMLYLNNYDERRRVQIALNADGSSPGQDAVHIGTKTGYYFCKMNHQRAAVNTMTNLMSQSIPLIRYAEILLAYAEASNEISDVPIKEETYDILFAIRKRAGIKPGEDQYYGLKKDMNQAEMRQAIRDERRIEFAMEGHRFFDVRRWMIADETDNQMMTGIEPRRVAGDPNKRDYVRFNVGKHIFRKAMYYWPIPYKEDAKSDLLIQNPYY